MFGVPNFRIINAAYTYPRPEGSRFNDGERGAWYCAFEVETSLAEISFHKTVEYQEIDRFDDSVTYQAMLADFTSTFHDIRGIDAYADCLDAGQLHRIADSWPTTCSTPARWASSTPACGTTAAPTWPAFRPALVGNVRKGQAYRLTWSGSPTPLIEPI